MNAVHTEAQSQATMQRRQRQQDRQGLVRELTTNPSLCEAPATARNALQIEAESDAATMQ